MFFEVKKQQQTLIVEVNRQHRGAAFCNKDVLWFQSLYHRDPPYYMIVAAVVGMDHLRQTKSSPFEAIRYAMMGYA